MTVSNRPRSPWRDLPCLHCAATIALLVSAGTAPAQRAGLSPKAADLVFALAQKHSAIKSLRARLTTETRVPGGWLISTQDLRFVAPDRFRLASVSTGDPLTEGTTSLCFGGESYLIPESTPLVRRWSRNLCLDWGSLSGGPANVAAFGTAYGSLRATYGGRVVGEETVDGRTTQKLILTANDPGRHLVQDFADTDFTRYWVQYAAYSLPQYDRPPEVHLYVDTERCVVLRREHHADGKLQYRADTTDTRELAPEVYFPSHFEVFGPTGALVQRVSYEELTLNPELDATNFEYAPRPNVLIEEAEHARTEVCRKRVRATPDDPSARYNLVLALLRNQQDHLAALSELETLRQRTPEALAPQLEHGRLLAFANRPGEAAERYGAVASAAPGIPIQPGYARALLAAGRPEEAAKALRKCPALSASAELQAELALAELRAGEYDQSAAHLLQAMQLPGAANASGRVAAARGVLALSRWHFGAGWLEAQLAKLPKCAAKSLLQGEAAAASGDVAGSAKHYAAALALDEHDCVSRLAAARSLLACGRAAEARPLLRHVAATLPEEAAGSEAAQLLAASLVAEGQLDEALSVITERIAALPGQAAPGRQRATFGSSVDKVFAYEPMRQRLEALAAERNKLDVTGYRLLAEMHQRLDDREAAATVYQRAARLFGTDRFLAVESAKAQIAVADRKFELLGRTGFKMRDYGEAIRAVERTARAAPLQPYYSQLLVALNDRWIRLREAGLLANKLLQDRPNDSDTCLVKGAVRPYGDVDNPKPRLPHLEKAIEISDASAGDRYEAMLFARRVLAKSYEVAKRPQDAAYQYRTALLSCPNPAQRIALRQAAAVMLVATGQPDGAVDLARDLATGDFTATERAAYFGVMGKLANTGKPEADALIAYIQTHLKQSPQDSVLAQLVGEINLQRKALPQALQAYETACSAAPGDGYAWIRLAMLQTQAGQSDAAVTSLANAVKAKPHDFEARKAYALALAEANRTDEALAQTHALMLHSTADHRAFAGLADVQAACGKLADAQVNYRLAVRLAQYDLNATLTEVATHKKDLAAVLGGAGHAAEAAAELEPLSAPPLPVRRRLEALYLQAHWLTEAKDIAAARQCLNRALELAPTNALKDETRKALAELDK